MEPIPVIACGSTSLGSSPTGQNPLTVGIKTLLLCQLNLTRKEIIIVNSGTTGIYISLGFSGDLSTFSVFLSPKGHWVSDIWKGAIYAVSDSPSGAVCVTEQV